ncbi:hypothetical protein AB0M20_07985 [Actinoplanes sp. NPDC051633]|uniref:hypothetical protein n=1 Tax=Actinoplanes sp. NPDC051633 TaxID=3155670 RepID=UPI00343088EC
MPSNLQPRLMLDITDVIYEVSQAATPKLDEKTQEQKKDFETKLPVWMAVLYARGRGWSAVFNVAVICLEQPTADVCEQVVPVGLEAFPWANKSSRGEILSGVAFKCTALEPVQQRVPALAGASA